jgi:outer membrane biosynthesis protein TonB
MKVFSKKLSETPVCLNKNIGDLTMLKRLMEFLGLSKKPEASSQDPVPEVMEVVEEPVKEVQPEKPVEPKPKKTTRAAKPVEKKPAAKPAAIKPARTKKATPKAKP